MEKEETFQSGAGSGEMEEKKNPVTTVIVGLLGVFSAIFLLNPGFGALFEIPDNIPVIGNLDEAAAAAILISCLAYFGVDIGSIFGRKKKDEDDVIDVEVQDR
ncbi:MAG: hypothetical protein MI807_20035 [Verrucomicrobiales bacterium]|nr:hypothetical protein [Verrucomicrobiales bacterium]